MTVPVTHLKKLRDAATQVITGMAEMQQVFREIEGFALDWADEAGNLDEPYVVQAYPEYVGNPEPAPSPAVEPVSNPEQLPEPDPQPEPEPEPEPQPEPEQTVTLEQVRAAMVKLARTHSTQAAKTILSDLGYTKLTDVPAAKLGDVLAAAETAQ
ncbi:hypothetical protein [Corynebacterium sp. H113]|uniref:hypothetical protein n=1 Tax=Corynebacterium sp. H113 TaxID=3133419 RepID=UPI00309B7928